MEEIINMHKILAGMLEGKIPFGRPKYRCVDNIKTFRRKIRPVNVD
jgi:hypothetical protein